MAIEILATCKKITCDCKFAFLHATKMSHQNFSHFYMGLKFEKFNLNIIHLFLFKNPHL